MVCLHFECNGPHRKKTHLTILHCRVNMFTEMLSSNSKGTDTDMNTCTFLRYNMDCLENTYSNNVSIAVCVFLVMRICT
jgi:hypothetical protein